MPTPTPANASHSQASAEQAVVVHRIEVSAAPGHADPIGESVKRDANGLGLPVRGVRSTRVYLLQGVLTPSQLSRISASLLTDSVVERSMVVERGAAAKTNAQIVEIHPLPGVMDPAALSVRDAIRDLLGLAEAQIPEVTTGWRYEIDGVTREQAEMLATKSLANPVIQRVVLGAHHPTSFPVGTPHDQQKRAVPIRGLDDEALNRLSRDAHLFLSLDEMKAIQTFYTDAKRDPVDIELETLAQTWSEHCVHKTLKSTVKYRGTKASGPQGEDAIDWRNRPGHEIHADGSITIHNLLKSTVAAATRTLLADGVDWTLSVFVDNSGVIAFDDQTAVCIKVETHNHPSAIEPYGGAATGVGGCIRDVIATGLGARPIANTDVFCVAFPEQWTDATLPPGTLHPRRILQQVVAGVRDYGNRMGIPTVAGAVAFDNRYVGNPLVYCGCIGVMPRSRVHGKVQRGDLIVAIGGRTGRDGIHGATFSSAELEHTAADEFSHAVQIGNAITEKQALDAILRAAEHGDGPLYNGMTDCGAGGFSSAIGELGKGTGAVVNLERAPLKYAGLSYTEIWISEAQERFVLAVPAGKLAALQKLCDEEGAELAVLGEFTNPPGSTPDNPDLQLLFKGQEVGRLSMHFLHEGIPTPHREASWKPGASAMPALGKFPAFARVTKSAPSLTDALPRMLAHPNIASKHWIVRQYDHEVRGGTVLKPLVGPTGRGPGDASIICPVPTSTRGLAISSGLQTALGDPAIGGDPYLMTLSAIDECIRNLVCVGTDPSRIAILDNFCWPSCKKPENLGSLVRAAVACYDGALAYRTPFVSGKDSLNNQLTITNADGTTTTIEIPPTLLITGMGIVQNVRKAVSMDAKQPGRQLVAVTGVASTNAGAMRGSIYEQLFGLPSDTSAESQSLHRFPKLDLHTGPATAKAVYALINSGIVHSAHDVSEGGTLVAIAEMLIAGSTRAKPIGAELTWQTDFADLADLFAEPASTYILEIDGDDGALDRLDGMVKRHKGVQWISLGTLTDSGKLSVLTSSGAEAQWDVEQLAAAWLKPLDW